MDSDGDGIDDARDEYPADVTKSGGYADSIKRVADKVTGIASSMIMAVKNAISREPASFNGENLHTSAQANVSVSEPIGRGQAANSGQSENIGREGWIDFDGAFEDARRGLIRLSVMTEPSVNLRGFIEVVVSPVVLRETGFLVFQLPSEVKNPSTVSTALTVTLINGAPLPSWVRFDMEQEQFIIEASADVAFPIKVRVVSGEYVTEIEINEDGAN